MSCSSFKTDHLKGLFIVFEILDISLRLGMNALRQVKDTGKHFFAWILVMSLDKNTGFP